jgi:catechol 2,3-dioxygenase-like lactoylglutathione lyase family enzyme
MGKPTIVRSAAYFPVDDVERIGAWYEEVLGFRCLYRGGDPVDFAIHGRDGAELMFRRVADPSAIRPNELQGGTWDVFFWVRELDALFAELSQKGATVVYPPTVRPYQMKEFALRDPLGYVLGFGEELG